jgi:outer membrane lipoprotein-sorting protein
MIFNLIILPEKFVQRGRLGEDLTTQPFNYLTAFVRKLSSGGNMIRKVLFIFVLIVYFGLVAEKIEEKITAKEIIRTMTEILNPGQSDAIMEMTIITSSNQERTFVYRAYSKNNGEKSLMKYLEPGRVKGQTILMLNSADDIWTYFPKTKRVRKLATHAKKQKVQGSDFSYEDLGSSDEFIDDYNSNLIGEEEKNEKLCYKLELTKKEDSDAGYSRLIMWVEMDNYVPVVMSYYHEKDPDLLEKELVVTEVKIIDDIPTPMKMVMYNRLDNTRTSMGIREVTYDVDLPDNLFTEMGMKK